MRRYTRRGDSTTELGVAMDYEERLAAIEAAGVNVTKLRQGLKGKETKHVSTLYEIDVVHLFVSAGFTDIVIEPSVPNSNKVADLLVHVENDDIYVEVEGWNNWSHHDHMYENTARLKTLMEERGYPAADIEMSNPRVSASTVISALPSAEDIDPGVAISGDGYEVTIVAPGEARHGIHTTRYESSGEPLTGAVRHHIATGYDQVKPASPEHATLVVVRPRVLGGVADYLVDALCEDRANGFGACDETLAGAGSLSVRAVRPLDGVQLPGGFQPTGLFHLDEYEGLSGAIVYCPASSTGKQATFVAIHNPHAAHPLHHGIAEAVLNAAQAERVEDE